MIFSENHKYCFLCPERTGSQSISKLLNKHYGPLRICNVYKRDKGENMIRYNDIHVCEIPKELKDFYVFATLRNPINRIVSLYCKFYVKAFSFSHFLSLDILKYHTFTNLYKGIKIDHFIRLENIQEDFNKLPFLEKSHKLPWINALDQYEYIPTIHEYEQLIEAVREDLVNYGYPEQIPQSSSSEFRCAHRGEKLRDENCSLCGLRGKTATVYSCDIHTECTIRRFQRESKIRTCVDCGDRKWPDTN